jgi:PAS domain S-box-containing protein
MVIDTGASGFKDKSYLLAVNGSVIDIGNAFTELTGYTKADVLKKDISEVINRLLRINSTVQDIEINKTNTALFLFTKSFEAMEVAISMNSAEDTHEKLYIFTERPNSRLEDKLTFVKQVFKDNVMACAVFSVPDMQLLKANQKFLDCLDSPNHRMENSIGKPFKEMLIGFEGTQAEAIYNAVQMTRETIYLNEYKHEGFIRDRCYWDVTLTPVFELGQLKYIFEIAADVTERVQDRQLREKQAKLIQARKDLLEAVIENMSDALLIFDDNGNITKINKFARATYAHIYKYFEKIGDGRKQTELYDANGFLIPFEDAPAFRVKRGEKLVGYRIKIKEGDKTLYIDVNGTPIYDDNGNFVAGLMNCRDVTEKINMEESLIESEAKFKDLFNNMLMAHAYYQIITDGSGKPIDYTIIEVNPAYETINGLKRNEIIGKNATEVFPGIQNSSVDWIGIFGEVALTGKTISNEIYSDLDDMWFNVVYYCPKPGYIASIYSDITERKNHEEELRKTKERLQEAQEFAHLGYWEFDTISGEMLWSDVLFRIYGFKPQKFIPTVNDFINVVHPDDKEFMIELMKEPIKEPIADRELKLDLRIVRQDNETIWIHEKVKFKYNASGKLVRMKGVVQDITLQKLSELKLKESEEKFKELAENLGEVIWIRQEEHLVYINPAYEKMWGRTCQSLYDNPHSFIDAIHPDDKEKVMQSYLGQDRTLKGLFEEQYRIVRPDGTICWIWERSLPICDENGKMMRCVGIADDITKIKELEEEALKNKMEKEMARLDKLSLVGAVAAGIGHEVRNPMTTVRGFLQLLGCKEECSKYNDYFSLMIEELDRANSIITEFLSLAKDRVVELEMQSLKEIVENIFPLIQADGLISDKYIHLKLDEVAEIPLDRKEIHQLILNLVLNGSQAMSPGGTMKIRTFMDKEEIVLSVKDDGPGIDQEVLGKIGTPFFTTKENGTGLGLAVCYSIAARHNAKIDIETGSTGTTFFVRFKK